MLIGFDELPSDANSKLLKPTFFMVLPTAAMITSPAGCVRTDNIGTYMLFSLVSSPAPFEALAGSVRLYGIEAPGALTLAAK